MTYYSMPGLNLGKKIDYYKCYLDLYPERVLEEVCDFYGITSDELINGGNSPKYVTPKQMCHYILRWNTSLSLRNIALLTNNADHSCVINSLKQIDKLMDVDESIKSQYKILVNRLS